MTLTPEQFNRCACECMASMVTPYDRPQELSIKAEIAVAAAEALSKEMTRAKRPVGPMDAKRRKS